VNNVGKLVSMLPLKKHIR